MLNLLIKDFKLMFRQDRKLISTILSTLLTMAFLGAFIAAEIFLFKLILDKIVTIPNAARAFLTVFLFATTILLIFADLSKAKKLFFNSKDIEQLSTHPVTNGQLILSKLIFLFFSHIVTSLIFQFPLFVAYGMIVNKMAMFYFTSIFYPVASFFFVGGVALLLVYPAWLITSFLKRHFTIQFALSLAVIILLSLIYSYVLDIFIKLIANNEMISLFSDQSIAKFLVFEKYAVPINFMVDLFVNKALKVLFPFLLISFGVFSIGLSIAIYAFHVVRKVSSNDTSIKKEHKFKTTSILNALIKKEFTIIAKNADYLYSFTGLLIVQPLLLQLVVKSINAVLGAGTIMYYTALVPGLIVFVDVLIIMFFSVVINQGANSYISMESNTIKVIKTIPVSYKTQLSVKVAIPYVFSITSLLVSLAVLMGTKTIHWSYGLLTICLTAVFLFVFELISLQEELNIRHNKKRSSFFSSVVAYVFPLAFAGTAILLSYYGISSYLAFLGGFGVCVIIGLYPIISVFKRAGDLFMDLEAKN